MLSRTLILCAFLASIVSAAPATRPTEHQLRWQRGELTLFIHFGVNTFSDREWGDGKEDPKIFNPTKLDPKQWAKAGKAAGAKIMILTAKHHDGFCLWPSAYTEHSVKNSPWKDGKGDVVREFVDACRAEGIRPGLYLSPWDRHEKTYGDSPKYNDYYIAQLTELLTNYGEIAEVWFDGACGEGPNGKRQVYDWPRVHGTVRKLQPGALMFSDAGPDIRWIGNERGIAGDPCWATVKPERVPFAGASGADVTKALQHGDEGGPVWRPGESDVSIRPGWFYHAKEDSRVRSVENLVDLYFKSVGRNSLLLLNIPPTKEGLLHETDVQRLADFRAKLNEIFKTDLARGKKATADGADAARVTDGDLDTHWRAGEAKAATIEIDLGAATKFNIVRLQEAIELGQFIAGYRVEAWDGNAWKEVSKGTTIGHMKLDKFAPVTASKVRLVIDRAIDAPAIAGVSVFLAE